MLRTVAAIGKGKVYQNNISSEKKVELKEKIAIKLMYIPDFQSLPSLTFFLSVFCFKNSNVVMDLLLTIIRPMEAIISGRKLVPTSIYLLISIANTSQHQFCCFKS